MLWKASRGQPSAIAELEGIQKIKVLISEESLRTIKACHAIGFRLGKSIQIGAPVNKSAIPIQDAHKRLCVLPVPVAYTSDIF